MDYKALIKDLVIKTLLKFSGLKAWVASFLFNVVWKQVIQPVINYFKVKKSVDKAADKYEKVVNDPNSSADDVANAFDDLNKS